MNSSSIVAPAIPRRTLWALGAVVAAMHLWALLALTLPTPVNRARPTAALHTRVLVPASASPAPVTKAAPAPPAPRQAATRRKPPVRQAKAPPKAAPAGTLSAPTPVTPTSTPEPERAEEAEALADYEHWLADLAPQEAAAPNAHAPAAPPSPEAANATAQEAPSTPPTPPAEPTATTKDTADTPAPTLTLPPPTQLAFEVSGHVKGFDYSARGELTWQTDGASYQVRQSISLLFLGSRAQQSNGRVTPLGLRPERFVDEARKTRSAQLDFGAHRVTFSDGATPSAAIDDGVQDRLSVFIQLGARIAAVPEDYPAGTRISFETVGARRVDHWTFLVQSQEVLHLPAGETPALKLQRLPQDGDVQTDELWLGTALHYLPVRIRLAQGAGDFVDLRLRGHETP